MSPLKSSLVCCKHMRAGGRGPGCRGGWLLYRGFPLENKPKGLVGVRDSPTVGWPLMRQKAAKALRAGQRQEVLRLSSGLPG